MQNTVHSSHDGCAQQYPPVGGPGTNSKHAGHKLCRRRAVEQPRSCVLGADGLSVLSYWRRQSFSIGDDDDCQRHVSTTQ